MISKARTSIIQIIGTLRRRPLHTLLLLCIILTYLVTRIGWPETIQFAYDQPKMAWETIKFLKHGTFLTSHEFNDITPFGNFSWSSSFIFILSPFFLISHDPILVSQMIGVYNLLSILFVCIIGWKFFSPTVGISAAFFLTVQPWWTIFSRMVYSPGMGPTLVSLCMLLTIILIKDHKTYLIGFIFALWGILSQIYISHFSIIFVSLLGVIKSFTHGVHVRSLLLGILFVGILFIPPAYYYYNHPLMFDAYFNAPQRFPDPEPFKVWFGNLAATYFSVMSGGAFQYELGGAQKEFLNQLSDFQRLPTVIYYFILLTLAYTVITLFFRKTKDRDLRLLLLLWATAPLWFMSFVRIVPLPRYFILAMPAFSVLFGIMLDEFSKGLRDQLLRRAFITVVAGLFSCWVIYTVNYYIFIRNYSYPGGLLSSFSDPPYTFVNEAMRWIEDDAKYKGYNAIVVSSSLDHPYDFDLVNGARYYWEYDKGRDFNVPRGAQTGYYQIYYSPLRDDSFEQQYRQFGPYIVYDYSSRI